MIKTTVLDVDQTEVDVKITIHRHPTNFNTLAEDVGNRVVEFLKHNPTGCIYFNPAVTVSCPGPLREFFQTIRREQARWCRQASETFPQKIRRRVSTWVSGGEWIRNKGQRYLDRALCFTGILFINGKMVLPHDWPKSSRKQLTKIAGPLAFEH